MKGGDGDAANAAGNPIPENAAGGIYARGAFLTSLQSEARKQLFPSMEQRGRLDCGRRLDK